MPRVTPASVDTSRWILLSGSRIVHCQLDGRPRSASIGGGNRFEPAYPLGPSLQILLCAKGMHSNRLVRRAVRKDALALARAQPGVRPPEALGQFGVERDVLEWRLQGADCEERTT